MSKLQGLLFGLATLLLVALATFFFTKTWLPTLVSDRGAIDSAMMVSLEIVDVATGRTELLVTIDNPLG